MDKSLALSLLMQLENQSNSQEELLDADPLHLTIVVKNKTKKKSCSVT